MKEKLDGELPILEPLEVPKEVSLPITLFDDDFQINSFSPNKKKKKIIATKKVSPTKCRETEQIDHSNISSAVIKPDNNQNNQNDHTNDIQKETHSKNKSEIESHLSYENLESIDNESSLNNSFSEGVNNIVKQTKKSPIKKSVIIKKKTTISPIVGGRYQTLYSTDILEITAYEFRPVLVQTISENDTLVSNSDSNSLESSNINIGLMILLVFHNKSSSPIKRIEIELLSTNNVQLGENDYHCDEILPHKDFRVKLTLEFLSNKDILTPRICKFRFIPISAAEIVECDLKIFPSLFLIASSLNEMPPNYQNEFTQQAVEIEGMSEKKVIQIVANIIQGKGIKNIICGKMITGECVICKVKEKKSSILVIVFSDHSLLSQFIAKEILMKIEDLSAKLE